MRFLSMLLATALLYPFLAINAQTFPGSPPVREDHGGHFVLGGLASFWHDESARNSTLRFEPEFGYLFNDDWGVGTRLSYAYGSGEQAHSIGVSPFVRYYYFHKEPFNLYLDAGAGWNVFWDKEHEARHGFEVGIRPGACVDLTEGLCLCIRLGFIGYRKDFRIGEEEGLGYSGYGFRFAPEELSIGLELEF